MWGIVAGFLMGIVGVICRLISELGVKIDDAVTIINSFDAFISMIVLCIIVIFDLDHISSYTLGIGWLGGAILGLGSFAELIGYYYGKQGLVSSIASITAIITVVLNAVF